MTMMMLMVGLLTAVAGQASEIRIGWQVPWAVQGQLVQILKNTDILKKQGLSVKFVGKTSGPELNELALAGQVDVILAADQPAATLFAKSDHWVGIARLMYNRTATYVPNSSSIKAAAELKGKTIGVPFGAAAQRILMEELKKQNLTSGPDYKLVNLGIQEHMPLILKTPNGEKWDQFDALSGFDPTPATLESKGLARVIHVGKVCSMIVMNQRFLEKHKADAKKLVTAFAEAYEYYKKHELEANKWFVAEAKLKDVDDKALRLAVSLEPNFSEPFPRMDFSQEDYQILEDAAQFVAKAAGKKVDMKSKVSLRFVD